MSEQDLFPQKSKFMNYIRACVLAFGGYYGGFCLGIMNPMAVPLGKNLYKLEGDDYKNFESNVNAYFTLGALVAVGLSGPLSNLIGRVRWMIVMEIVGIGLGYLYTIENVTALYVARCVSGVISSSGFTIGVIAIAEMFPGSISGFCGLFMYITLTGFILITSCIKPYFNKDD